MVMEERAVYTGRGTRRGKGSEKGRRERRRGGGGGREGIAAMRPTFSLIKASITPSLPSSLPQNPI